MQSDVAPLSYIPGWTPRRGKVRDIYDLKDRLLIVSSDRISAFDWILPTSIPDKGRVLTQLSAFWFKRLGTPNHLLSLDVSDIALPEGTDVAALEGRVMVVRKAEVAPVECVARGYLAGSGWKEYRRDGSVCGIKLPQGLLESARLEPPIFTPATKATEGHDENVSFERVCEIIGDSLAGKLRDETLRVYCEGAEYARSKGLIVADTKLEWGLVGDELILVDEVLTPDSSRFWPADGYAEGTTPFAFDKQFVRDWLDSTTWDKSSPPPALPDEVVEKTRARYIEAFERLTGQSFAWK